MSLSDEYQSVSDDILKPKIKIAELKAIELWENYCDRKIPVVLNDIIQKMAIPTVGMDNISTHGYTKTDSDGNTIIVYNKNIPPHRQRFTVAHELGHIALEHTSIFGDCDQYSKKSQEKEADAFAGELLIPSPDLKFFLKTPKSIQEIIDRYNTSKEVIFIAIQKNKLLKKIKS